MIKFNSTQQLRLKEALRHSSEVLKEVKAKKLNRDEVKGMRALEEAVQNLEVLTFQ